MDLRDDDLVYLDGLVHGVHIAHGKFGFTWCYEMVTLLDDALPFCWRRCELLPGGLVTCLLCIGDLRG